jgi:hypothetical protein
MAANGKRADTSAQEPLGTPTRCKRCGGSALVPSKDGGHFCVRCGARSAPPEEKKPQE